MELIGRRDSPASDPEPDVSNVAVGAADAGTRLHARGHMFKDCHPTFISCAVCKHFDISFALFLIVYDQLPFKACLDKKHCWSRSISRPRQGFVTLGCQLLLHPSSHSTLIPAPTLSYIMAPSALPSESAPVSVVAKTQAAADTTREVIPGSKHAPHKTPLEAISHGDVVMPGMSQ